jgi:hypothetical protein
MKVRGWSRETQSIQDTEIRYAQVVTVLISDD